MRSYIAVLVLAASAAVAQLDPNALPECVKTCSTAAALATPCQAFTNVSCVCVNQEFQSLAGACLLANCTAAETATALSTQTAACAALAGASTTTTASPTASPTTKPDAGVALAASSFAALIVAAVVAVAL